MKEAIDKAMFEAIIGCPNYICFLLTFSPMRRNTKGALVSGGVSETVIIKLLQNLQHME